MSEGVGRGHFMVDFNMVDELGRVAVLIDGRGDPLPRAGDTVTLRDYDGDRCLGRVVGATDRLLLVEPDFASWQSGPSGARSPAAVPG